MASGKDNHSSGTAPRHERESKFRIWEIDSEFWNINMKMKTQLEVGSFPGLE